MRNLPKSFLLSRFRLLRGQSLEAGEICLTKDSTDGKVRLTEARAIIDYSRSSLDTVCRLISMAVAASKPESNLMPKDPAQAAQVSEFMNAADMDIIGPLTVCNRISLKMGAGDQEVIPLFVC